MIVLRPHIAILLLLTVCLSAQAQTTCGTNCDAIYDALDAQSNIDFNSIAAGGDGFRTVCLQGDQGGFDWSSNLNFKTTSRLYICETSDAVNINITGNLRFDGTVDIYVEGTSEWTDISTMSNNVDIWIDEGDTLEWDESGTSTLDFGNDFDLFNDGTLLVNDNINGDRDDMVWDSNGDIIINGNVNNWNFDLTMDDTTTLDINGNVTSNAQGSIVSDGTVSISGNMTSMDMDITMNDSTFLEIGGTWEGTQNSTVTINGDLEVTGNVDQDFDLIINPLGRVEAYANWEMEYRFDNDGAWIVDGIMDFKADQTSDFSGGYILADTIVWSGTNNFSSSASNCGFIIFNSLMPTTNAALSVTPVTTIGLVSISTIDNTDGDYDDFDMLENAGFTFPNPLTDSDNGDLINASFNNFINAKDCENHILPLSLLNFQATRDRGQVNINWTVAALYAFEHMILERSTDGTNFESLGSFNADYTTELTLQSYEYTDVIDAKVVYYRLVIVDRFGNSNYSYMVAVGGSELQPITELSERTFEILSHSSETFTIRAYTSHGQVLAQESNTRSLDLSGLASGVYLIEISGYLVEKVLLD